MPSATSPSRLAESWGTHCPTRSSTVGRSDATWAARAAAAEPPADREPVDPDPVESDESLSDDAATGTGTPTVTVGVATGVGAGAPKITAGRAARTPTASSTTATTIETPATIHGTVERAGAAGT